MMMMMMMMMMMIIIIICWVSGIAAMQQILSLPPRRFALDSKAVL
jgi:hypothetical protein